MLGEGSGVKADGVMGVDISYKQLLKMKLPKAEKASLCLQAEQAGNLLSRAGKCVLWGLSFWVALPCSSWCFVPVCIL